MTRALRRNNPLWSHDPVWCALSWTCFLNHCALHCIILCHQVWHIVENVLLSTRTKSCLYWCLHLDKIHFSITCISPDQVSVLGFINKSQQWWKVTQVLYLSRKQFCGTLLKRHTMKVFQERLSENARRYAHINTKSRLPPLYDGCRFTPPWSVAIWNNYKHISGVVGQHALWTNIEKAQTWKSYTINT